MSYDHYIGVTSQAYFCASPLRLDTQSRCQMGCTYCFAKARGGHRSEDGIQFVSDDALRRRLCRVQSGDLRSVTDEFLAKRTPVQLGGMSDPFSQASVRRGVTGKILGLLAEYDYPAILSTKGRFKDVLAHADALGPGNFYVRVSMAASQFAKSIVEPGTPSENETFDTIQALAETGVPVCLRLQPMFPGAEEEALRLMVRGHHAGSVATSIEYLKVPRERGSSQYKALNNLFHGRLLESYETFGASISGREISVGIEYKKHHLSLLKKQANALGIRVVIAENELLHYGDLEGCCNGASEFLRNASNFEYTVPAMLKKVRQGGQIRLADFDSVWCPTGNIGAHFNSDSRLGLLGAAAHWKAYFNRHWETRSAHFNPTFFDGVSGGLKDEEGRSVYTFEPSPEFSR
jgi:DNA repair photolyase